MVKSKENVSSTLEMMMLDLENADELFRPTKYWAAHVKEIISDVTRNGIENFRCSGAKGIQAFGAYSYKPIYSYRPRLWKLLNTLENIPIINKVISAIKEEIDNGYAIAGAQASYKVRIAHELICNKSPGFLDNFDDENHGRANSISINNKNYTETFLLKSLDYLDILEHVKNTDLNSILEIGSGFGGLAEIFLRKHKQLRYIIVDIPPILLFSEWYLKKILHNEVLGYKESRKIDKINLDDIDKRVIILAPWDLHKLSGDIDLFINQASFQEMTIEVVKNYANKIKNLGVKEIFLDNGITDNKERPGLNREFYISTFSPLELKNEWRNILHPGYTRLLFS